MAFPGGLSPARRDLRPDGRRDLAEDLRNDEISELQLDEDGEDALELLDPWEAKDVMAHRKKIAVWSLSKRRVAERRAAVEEDRPSLTTLETSELLLRNAAIPNAVWTVGDGSHGQCGHIRAAPPHIPHPASLELHILRDGVRGIFAGPYCTLFTTHAGETRGFGSGSFRGALDAPKPSPPSTMAFEGAPPFRVRELPPGLTATATEGGVGASCDATAAAASSNSVAGGRGGGGGGGHREGSQSGGDGRSDGRRGASFERTEDAVHASIDLQASAMAVPSLLTGLLMPVNQVALGEHFCVALMQNGLVFSWGDG